MRVTSFLLARLLSLINPLSSRHSVLSVQVLVMQNEADTHAIMSCQMTQNQKCSKPPAHSVSGSVEATHL